MVRLIRSFLGAVVVVSLLVTNAAAFQAGLAGSSAPRGKRMKTAEKLARGLPPNPPAARYTPGVLRARDGASVTITSSGPPTPSSSPPKTSSGPPATSSSPPKTSSGPPATSSSPPKTSSGPPATSSSPPKTSSGPPATSSSPPTTLTPRSPVTCPIPGYIGYTNHGNDGYVSVSSANSAWLGFVLDTADAVVVTFDMCATGLVDIQCLTCDPSYIGVLTQTFSPESFTSASEASGLLGLLEQAPPGPPVNYPSEWDQVSETTVWSYNKTTSALTLNWDNDDHSDVTLSASYLALLDCFVISYSATPTASFYFVPQV